MLVYKITNKVNNKIYIGVTVETLEKRWNSHIRNLECGRTYRLYNAMRSYGLNNFTIEVIETCESISHLKERETFYIKEWATKSVENGYNMTDGGDGTWGKVVSEETKAKISQSASGRVTKNGLVFFVYNNENELVAKLYGVKNLSLFIGLAEQTLRGYFDKTTTIYKKGFRIKKVKNADKLDVKKYQKKGISKEHHAKLIEGWKKKDKTLIKEIFAKAQEKYVKVVGQYDLSDNLIATFKGAREAEKLTGISRGAIRGAIKDSRISKGFKWKFINIV